MHLFFVNKYFLLVLSWICLECTRKHFSDDRTTKGSSASTLLHGGLHDSGVVHMELEKHTWIFNGTPLLWLL